MIKYKKIPDGREYKSYPFDEQKQICYRRIFAGFVAPGPKFGAIVVCGQEFVRRPPTRIYWLAECQEQTLDRLIHKALDMKAEFKISEFFSWEDKDLFRYLMVRNATAREKGMKELHIQIAPNAETENITYQINILQSFLIPNKKTLLLGASKLLPAALQALPLTDVSQATVREHPLVAALGYAVTAIQIYGDDFGFNNKPKKAKIEYDILNYRP